VSSITAHNITKIFRSKRGEVVALDDVSLEVPDGHFTCVVGASGCGKSTLLSIMGGLTAATSGSVTVDGRVVTEPGPDRGMVFQKYTLYPWLRVRQNIEFGPSIRRVRRAERAPAARALLEEVGLAEFENAYPRELSGGMQQRVAIARALANDPKVLLMDEPFGALDALTRASAQRTLTSVWEQHRRTIVFITHDIEEALLLGDAVIVMSPRPGRIREILHVDLPRPRTPELIATPEFAALKGHILGQILDQKSA
jgi:NitT/TauT family transport system ATP-binding protein